MTHQKYTIGIDIGGTKIAIGVYTIDGKNIISLTLPTIGQQGPSEIIRRIIESTKSLIVEAGLSLNNCLGIGIASPGPLDIKEGVVYNPPNLPGWNRIPLVKLLEEAFSLPVFLENDANAALIGEWVSGVGKGYSNLVYITVSTGVGASMIIDNHILRGKNGGAGEFGHTIVDINGPICNCGNRGCIEAYASGTAIEKKVKEAVRKGLLPTWVKTATDLAITAESGNIIAKEILTESFRMLGIGIVNLIHLYNPERIIIGGGVSNTGKILFDTVNEVVMNKSFDLFKKELTIVPAGLGNEVGVVGAASLPLLKKVK